MATPAMAERIWADIQGFLENFKKDVNGKIVRFSKFQKTGKAVEN